MSMKSAKHGARVGTETVLRSLASACSPGKARWALQDAKAKFSEVVQRALDGEPQCISRQGKDAVIIVSYDAIMNAVNPPDNLFEFLQSSPLANVDLDVKRMAGGFREVEV
jgi:prevent-host-death family protein